MKVAVSIPDAVFADAEALARRMSSSRSEIYARALREFVRNHDPDALTEAWNAVIEEVGSEPDEWLRRTSNAVLARNEW